MTKGTIQPGICGFTAQVTARSEDQMEVEVHVTSGCKAVQGMMEALGSTFDAYELCLVKPGQGPFYEYAGEHFPGHASCPVISGILKCVEVECRLALPSAVSVTVEKE